MPCHLGNIEIANDILARHCRTLRISLIQFHGEIEVFEPPFRQREHVSPVPSGRQWGSSMAAAAPSCPGRQVGISNGLGMDSGVWSGSFVKPGASTAFEASSSVMVKFIAGTRTNTEDVPSFFKGAVTRYEQEVVPAFGTASSLNTMSLSNMLVPSSPGLIGDGDPPFAAILTVCMEVARNVTLMFPTLVIALVMGIWLEL